MRHLLLLVSAFAFAAPAIAAPAVTHTIALYSFGYNPSPIVLEAGKPVTLTFVNRSKGAHDFTARKFFASSRIIAGSAPGGEIDLSGGRSQSITLVPAAGRYKAHCGHTMHSVMGMKADIIVR